ncbi:hypothetical protein PMIN03_011110 [Paraphaeosphaeria minitans]
MTYSPIRSMVINATYPPPDTPGSHGSHGHNDLRILNSRNRRVRTTVPSSVSAYNPHAINRNVTYTNRKTHTHSRIFFFIRVQEPRYSFPFLLPFLSSPLSVPLAQRRGSFSDFHSTPAPALPLDEPPTPSTIVGTKEAPPKSNEETQRHEE